MSEQVGSIYKITNKLNGKVYIGQTTKTIEERWQGHLKSAKFPCNHLQYALNLHGQENFLIEVLEQVAFEQLNEREIYWIGHYNSTDGSIGYNSTFGGDNGIPTNETRKRNSLAHIGKYPTEETKKKMSKTRTGKNLTDEHIEHISQANKGREFTDEHRLALSNSHKGKPNPLKGQPLTEATCKKMSEAWKGRIISDEHKHHISQALTGKTFPEERKYRMREAIKRWWQLRREAIA